MELKKRTAEIVSKPLYSAYADGAAFLFAALTKMIRCLSMLAVILILSVPSAIGAETVTTRPKLIVGGDHDSPPYEYLENGMPTGFNIELMQAVADVMGFKVEFKLGPWREVRRDLEQGRVDVLAGMYYSADRGRLIDFSVPHTLVTSGIFVRKDSSIRSYDDIQGKEIIVQNGDIIHDSLSQRGLASRIVAVTEAGQVFKLLASGKHECAIFPSRLQGEHLVKNLGLANIRIINAELPQLHYCFAVRKGNHELLYQLDEGLKILKVNGIYRDIHDKWFGVYERKSLWDTAKGYVFFVFAGFTSLFAASFVWSRSLRRQVGIRTAELRESEEKFRILAETIPSAIIVYQEEKLVYVNPAAIEATGYSEQECMQMRFWDLASDDFKELIRDRGIARQRGEKIPSQYEYQWVTKSGEKKWAFISSARIEYKGKPAGIAMLVDISDRRRMEEELHQAHDELEKRVMERTEELARATEALTASEKEKSLILNITDDILIFYDPDMNILWANKAAGASVNMTHEELRKRRCWEAWHQRQEPCFGCPVLLARDTGQPQEMEVRSPDQRVWFIRAYPVRDESGRLIGMVEFTQDFTERKLIEEELERQKSRLQELNSTLENRVREEVTKNREKDILLIQQNRQAAMGELLEHIAHQWKQPLTVVSLVIQNLWYLHANSKLTADKVRETIDTTTDLLEHMAHTIEDFRDFYRPDKKKTVFSITDSVDKALAFISPALKHESIAVDVDVVPGLLAMGYPREYIQVLLNVLSNARDALIDRKTEEATITIRGVAEGTRAVITITDNAGGIPESVVHSIFDLYVTTKEARGGTGIGLHMSKNIIEKNMDGSLTAHNTNSGAQFRIAVNMPEMSASAGTGR